MTAFNAANPSWPPSSPAEETTVCRTSVRCSPSSDSLATAKSARRASSRQSRDIPCWPSSNAEWAQASRTLLRVPLSSMTLAAAMTVCNATSPSRPPSSAAADGISLTARVRDCRASRRSRLSSICLAATTALARNSKAKSRCPSSWAVFAHACRALLRARTLSISSAAATASAKHVRAKSPCLSSCAASAQACRP